MLNIFRKNHNDLNAKSLGINNINKQNNEIMKDKSVRDEYKNIVNYPSSSKE